MTQLPRLYAVADGTFGDPVRIARELIDGGSRLVQIRYKSASAKQLTEAVDEILRSAPSTAQLIVNDRADVAMVTGAHGVHLGQEDLPPSSARNVLAHGQLIGYSTHNLQQALDADRLPIDYMAVGPIFSTTTKRNPDPVVGLKALEDICSRVKKPVVAIGGITLESALRVLDCGVASVAVIGDILRHGRIADRTREWVRQVDG